MSNSLPLCISLPPFLSLSFSISPKDTETLEEAFLRSEAEAEERRQQDEFHINVLGVGDIIAIGKNDDDNDNNPNGGDGADGTETRGGIVGDEERKKKAEEMVRLMKRASEDQFGPLMDDAIHFSSNPSNRSASEEDPRGHDGSLDPSLMDMGLGMMMDDDENAKVRKKQQQKNQTDSNGNANIANGRFGLFLHSPSNISTDLPGDSNNDAFLSGLAFDNEGRAPLHNDLEAFLASLEDERGSGNEEPKPLRILMGEEKQEKRGREVFGKRKKKSNDVRRNGEGEDAVSHKESKEGMEEGPYEAKRDLNKGRKRASRGGMDKKRAEKLNRKEMREKYKEMSRSREDLIREKRKARRQTKEEKKEWKRRRAQVDHKVRFYSFPLSNRYCSHIVFP